MPKVVLSENEKKNDRLRRVFRASMILCKKNPQEVAAKVRIAESTHYSRMKNPENMRLKELRRYREVLHIPDEDILSFL